MSDVADLVMPVLQAIQARLGSMERLLNEHTRTLADHGRKLSDIESRLGSLTSIQSLNKFDVAKLRSRLTSV